MMADPLPGEPTGRTILLVEDDAIISLDQKETLESFGYLVRSVYTGEEAVETIRSGAPVDLVLMDIDLGSGLSGDEAAEEILALRRLPIVFLSSHASRDFVERVKRITRYGYVLKNSGEFVLRDAIEVAFELLEARNTIERFFSVNPDLLCLTDLSGTFLKVNQSWEELLGFSPEDMEGVTLFEFVHPEDREATLDVVRGLQSGEVVRGFVNRYRHGDGGYRYLEWHAQVSGNLVYSAARDITERRRLEAEREAAIEEYDTIFNRTQIAMFLVEVREDGNFAYVRNNRFHQEITGMSPEELVGRTPVDILGADAGNDVLAHYRRCVETRRPVEYEVHLGTNGRSALAKTTITPVVHGDRVCHIVGWSHIYREPAGEVPGQIGLWDRTREYGQDQRP